MRQLNTGLTILIRARTNGVRKIRSDASQDCAKVKIEQDKLTSHMPTQGPWGLVLASSVCLLTLEFDLGIFFHSSFVPTQAQLMYTAVMNFEVHVVLA